MLFFQPSLCAKGVCDLCLLRKPYLHVSGYHFLKTEIFFRFCFPFTHKRQFCATKTLVLGPVHTYPDIIENREIYLFVSKKKKKIYIYIYIYASTPSVFESFFPVDMKTLNITFVRIRLFWTDTYHPKTCQCIHQICSYQLGRWLQWDPFHHSYCEMLMQPNHLSQRANISQTCCD